MSLQGKHIVLGITGSIAAYKSATLIRLLIKKGAEVQVVITPSGKEFITPLTLSTLTQKPVVSEFFDRRDGSWHSHVSLGLWADLMLIAPASAATLAKMVTGVADNMLLTTYLSMKAPVWVAPAMDLDMYRHPATQSNLQTLRERGVHVVEPGDGFLASGLEGKGRMEEPEQIAQAVAQYFEAEEQECKEPSLAGIEVLITAGPTYEPIDAVRFIGNYSSGRMGYALAAECARRGAQVHLVSGPSSLPDPQGVHVERVSTACEMLAACQKVSNSCRLAIFSAAVADYRPEHKAEGKMKRESTGASMSLSLVKNPDIAATLGAEKKEKQIMVGFALETSSDHEEARRKMARKGMDLMVLNSINDRGAGFGTPTNKVTLIPQEGEPLECSLKSKEEVAKDILNYLTNHYLQQ
jgi:phosphopantothenoylcysteine decarboxylase/phosphopantothenate--cysteine ligase